MCNPLAFMGASFLIKSTAAVMQYGANVRQSQEQDAYYENNRVNAINAGNIEDQRLAMRQVQEENAGGEKKFDNMLETRARARKAEAGAGEAGITGLSVESLLRDIYQTGERAGGRIQSNTDATLEQLNAERNGVPIRVNDRINSVSRGKKPSMIGLGLQIAGAGVDSYTGYRSMTK